MKCWTEPDRDFDKSAVRTSSVNKAEKSTNGLSGTGVTSANACPLSPCDRQSQQLLCMSEAECVNVPYSPVFVFRDQTRIPCSPQMPVRHSQGCIMQDGGARSIEFRRKAPPEAPGAAFANCVITAGLLHLDPGFQTFSRGTIDLRGVCAG